MANATEVITIQGKSLRVPVKYAEGHTLKANEASALNQTFWENLRNNFASKVKEGVEAGLDDSTLQEQLDDYAADYEFGERRGGGGFRGDPVMTAAMGIAREMIRTAVKAKGIEEFSAAKVTETAKALLEKQGPDGVIINAARAQVEAEKKAADSTFAEVSEVLASA